MQHWHPVLEPVCTPSGSLLTELLTCLGKAVRDGQGLELLPRVWETRLELLAVRTGLAYLWLF